MKQKIIMSLLLASSMMLVFAGTAHAGDAAAAKEKSSMCEGCHGIGGGYKTAFPLVYHVPKIGGQHEEYLVKALQGYQNGTRSHPTMDALVKSLSEQDIKDFAAYYAAN